MAKIIDPDALTQGTEIIFNTTARTIQLIASDGYNLTSPDGVTLQAVYSFCKEEWKTDANLIKLPFPLEAITEAKFDLINEWTFADATTQTLVRDAGWSVRDGNGTSYEEYFGFITLGTMVDSANDRAYYQQEVGGTTVDTVFTGPVNEPVLIYSSDATVIDVRTFFKAFLREPGKVYSAASLAEQAVTDIDYTVYKIPLANSLDPKIEATDGEISTEAPYTSMTIDYVRGTGFDVWSSGTIYSVDDVVQSTDDGRWYRATVDNSDTSFPTDAAPNWETYPGERLIGSFWYPFNVIVDGASAVAENIYEFTQWSNRLSSDINDDTIADSFGVVAGNTADQLLSFLGDTLVTGDGVYIDNFNSNDTNRIEFGDVNGTSRTFPFVAAGTIAFNQNLIDDPGAKFWMFFADPDGVALSGDEYGTTGAIIVNDNNGVPISTDVNGQSSYAFTFDYDNNTQGGRTSGTSANVVIIALGLDTAQWVRLDGQITRSTGLNFSLVSALERNYTNPA